MLHLSKLEISGFKSFVDPVTVEFPSGITAIVGPNGCGKSNLSDAITWVLGEQSAKSLRGAKMEDVIFNGTGKRRPVGMAEVEITLTTDTQIPAAVDGRIVIGRRVFRSGEGQYLLNGKLVRLKQIRDHLMDTGLGIRAYSVIEQGRIGMILSGKPQERRMLLEEAAGITRYKNRKRIAEIKLEEALSNLTRLDDLISEVERGLRALKRQAGAARRYKTTYERFEEILEAYLGGQLLVLASRIREIDTGLDARVDDDSRRDTELSRSEALLTAGREELDLLSQALADRHRAHAEISAKIEGRQEFLTSSRRRLEEMGERLDSGQKHALERRRLESEYRSSLGNLDERAKVLMSDRESAQASVAEQDERVEAAIAKLRESERRRDMERQRALEVMGRLNDESGRVQALEIEVEKNALRLKMLHDEGAKITDLIAELSASLSLVDATILELQTAAEERSKTSAATEKELEELSRRETVLGARKQDLQSELSALRQRQTLLGELEQEREIQRQERRAELSGVGIENPTLLSDLLQIVDGWESSIDHFLGELGDAVVVDPTVSVLDLARRLSERRLTTAFLVPLEGDPPSLRSTTSDEIPGTPLGTAMGLDPSISTSLPPARLVTEPVEKIVDLARKHPGTAFLSREGIWTLAGTIRAAGDAIATGTLSRRSELERLSELVPSIEKQLSSVAAELETLRHSLVETASRLRLCQTAEQEARQQLAVVSSQREDVVRRRESHEIRLQAISNESGILEQGSREQHVERTRLRAAVAATAEEVEKLNRIVAQSEEGLALERDRLEALRTERASRRGRLELIEERLSSQTRQVTEIKGQIRYTEEQLGIWAAENDNLEERRLGLGVSIEEAETELGRLLGLSEGAQNEVLTAQQAAEARREELMELEGSVRSMRSERDEARALTEALRIERARVHQELRDTARRYRDESKGELGEAYRMLLESPEAAEGDPSTSASSRSAYRVAFDALAVDEIDEDHLAELEMELARCKAVLDRIGPVNLLAAEEHDEQEERFEFLSTQRKDVADSVRSIKSTIAEINETSESRFRETFEEVNTRFNSVFASLFRGGEAHMRLLDSEDMLETGIEIIARPPGKREQNLMLLSGGEKAMTAIALLFALFQTKPSPFCILDEVDAPLDDINVTRFVDVLQEMADSTQFLIITHNKLTMQVARSLYGVTMEEKGISRIVGVEIDEIHPSMHAASA